LTTLVILLPPRDLSRPADDWQLGALPFVLFADTGQEMRTGYATLSLMPTARRHVLLLAARDVVLLRARVPALKGARLRLVLPNLIEEQLISDPTRSHVAVGADGSPDGERTIAVVDRAWLRFVLTRFQSAERAGLRVVPSVYCLPPVTAGEAAANVFGQIEERETDRVATLEVALQDAASVCGMNIPAEALEVTARQFAGTRPLVLRLLTSAAAHLEAPAGLAHAAFAERIEMIEFTGLARRALSADLDLCQFEFAAQAWQSSRNQLRRWRMPLALAAAIIVVCVIALNLDWLLLAHERDGLAARANGLFLESFPKTKTVLDAPLQMSRELDALRVHAGAPDSADFLVLCDRLARSLGPIGPNAVASVDYAGHALTIAFAPGVATDAKWPERLAAVGLKAEASGNKYVIRSRS
jgi:general secretion pathway protein L